MSPHSSLVVAARQTAMHKSLAAVRPNQAPARDTQSTRTEAPDGLMRTSVVSANASRGLAHDLGVPAWAAHLE